METEWKEPCPTTMSWAVATWAAVEPRTPSSVYTVDDEGKDSDTVCEIDQFWTLEEKWAIARLIAAAPALLAACEEIEKGEGAFSRDPLTHATNCIENMKSIARAAIRLAKEGANA